MRPIVTMGAASVICVAQRFLSTIKRLTICAARIQNAKSSIAAYARGAQLVAMQGWMHARLLCACAAAHNVPSAGGLPTFDRRGQ